GLLGRVARSVTPSQEHRRADGGEPLWDSAPRSRGGGARCGATRPINANSRVDAFAPPPMPAGAVLEPPRHRARGTFSRLPSEKKAPRPVNFPIVPDRCLPIVNEHNPSSGTASARNTARPLITPIKGRLE